MPALHVAGTVVRRNVVGTDVARIDVLQIHEAVRIALLRRAEAGGRRIVQAGAKRHAARGHHRRKLIHDGIQNVRQVVGEQILAAHAIEVDVADAVTGADHRLRQNVVGEAEARSPVVAIRVDQRPIVDGSFLRLDQRSSSQDRSSRASCHARTAEWRTRNARPCSP